MDNFKSCFCANVECARAGRCLGIKDGDKLDYFHKVEPPAPASLIEIIESIKPKPTFRELASDWFLAHLNEQITAETWESFKEEVLK